MLRKERIIIDALRACGPDGGHCENCPLRAYEDSCLNITTSAADLLESLLQNDPIPYADVRKMRGKPVFAAWTSGRGWFIVGSSSWYCMDFNEGHDDVTFFVHEPEEDCT